MKQGKEPSVVQVVNQDTKIPRAANQEPNQTKIELVSQEPR